MSAVFVEAAVVDDVPLVPLGALLVADLFMLLGVMRHLLDMVGNQPVLVIVVLIGRLGSRAGTAAPD